jgi:8-oxo-dGTP diphosphatase
MGNFHGAKVALLLDEMVLVYQRDDFSHIPFPGMWDLAGGQREGEETPAECAIRETFEEFAITIDPDSFLWHREYVSAMDATMSAHFFVASISRAQVDAVQFGEEGQRWALVPLTDLLAREDFVPHLRERLRHYVEAG